MASSTMTAAKTTAAHQAASARKGAIALIKADHEAVCHRFAEYAKTGSVTNEKPLITEICMAQSA